MGRNPRHKVVEQVLTCHQQRRQSKQGDVDPLVSAKPTHLKMATEERLVIRFHDIVSELYDMLVMLVADGVCFHLSLVSL